MRAIDSYIQIMFSNRSANLRVSVGLTDVTLPKLKSVDPEGFHVAICGQYGSIKGRSSHQMECPGRSVIGRYLVVQTGTSGGFQGMCEIQATVEGT